MPDGIYFPSATPLLSWPRMDNRRVCAPRTNPSDNARPTGRKSTSGTNSPKSVAAPLLLARSENMNMQAKKLELEIPQPLRKNWPAASCRPSTNSPKSRILNGPPCQPRSSSWRTRSRHSPTSIRCAPARQPPTPSDLSWSSSSAFAALRSQFPCLPPRRKLPTSRSARRTLR